MFEDIAHNLAIPHARGMITTLVVPATPMSAHGKAWEQQVQNQHIDFITDDLTAFLQAIIGHQG
jgi:putative hydrolase of the HAD superfamily